MSVQHDNRVSLFRRRPRESADEQALVARLEALSADFDVTPEVEFRAATRSRLVAMAAVRTPATAPGRRAPADRPASLRRLVSAGDSRWRTRVTAGLAGAALTVTVLGGLLAAAQGARPGDLLYEVKRGGEQTELALAGASERGLTLLGFATTRLGELGELVRVSGSAAAVVPPGPSGGELGLAAGPDVDLVLDTLQTMDRQTVEGTAALTARAVESADQQALDTLVGWTDAQRSGIDALVPAVPTGTDGAVDTSRDLVDAVAARGTGLLEALTCPGGPSTEGADELGPLPAPCPAPRTPGNSTAPRSAGGAAPSGTAPGTAVVPGATPGSPATAAPSGGGGANTVPGGVPGGAAPTSPAPVPSTSRPGLPLPGVPTPTATTPSPGAVVELPPVIPGLRVCAPPLITVDCRPSGG